MVKFGQKVRNLPLTLVYPSSESILIPLVYKLVFTAGLILFYSIEFNFIMSSIAKVIEDITI